MAKPATAPPPAAVDADPVLPAAAPPPAASTPTPTPTVEALVTELVPIDSVTPDPHNAREHNERSITAVLNSLKDFGQRKPIVVSSDGIVIAGNGTLEAARRMGWTHINITRTKLDADQARRYGVADNRTGDLSYFDEGALADVLREIPDADLASMGFDAAEAEQIIASAADPMAAVTTPSKKTDGQAPRVTVRLMISVTNVEAVEAALSLTGESNREAALMRICEFYRNAKR